MNFSNSTELAGRVCVVTGANTGIGKEIARGLATKGSTVILACRDLAKGEAAAEDIRRTTHSERVSVMKFDASSQASIRAFAQDFKREHALLHVLVNNAGIWTESKSLSVDGIEMTWATNVLGYFLLTECLRDILTVSGPSRIVSVASKKAGGLDLSDVQFARRKYNGVAAYEQSKQANRMWTWALARRLDPSRVTANALHPGVIHSEIASRNPGLFGFAAKTYFSVVGKSVHEGADTPVWLATSDAVEGRTGTFFYDRTAHRCRFRNEPEEERLWALLESQTHG